MKRILSITVILCFIAALLLFFVNYRTDSDLSRQVRRPKADGDAPEPVNVMESSAEGSLPALRKSNRSESVQDPASLTPSFRERLQVIVSRDTELFPERHKAIQSLSDQLSKAEIEALYEFLKTYPGSTNISRIQDRALKNALINRLRAQEKPPERLTSVLVSIFNDKQQDVVVRDYALQQMHAWYDSAPSNDRAVIRAAVVQALEERGESIAGTALLALRGLARNPEDQPTGEALPLNAAESALSVLRSPDTSELSRITAMQVAAELAPEEVAVLAAEWIRDPASGYPRRLSAIAALGASGSESAVEILTQVKECGDPHLKPAVDAALQRIAERPLDGPDWSPGGR